MTTLAVVTPLPVTLADNGTVVLPATMVLTYNDLVVKTVAVEVMCRVAVLVAVDVGVDVMAATPALPAGMAMTLLVVELKLVFARLITRLSRSYTT